MFGREADGAVLRSSELRRQNTPALGVWSRKLLAGGAVAILDTGYWVHVPNTGTVLGTVSLY